VVVRAEAVRVAAVPAVALAAAVVKAAGANTVMWMQLSCAVK